MTKAQLIEFMRLLPNDIEIVVGQSGDDVTYSLTRADIGFEVDKPNRLVVLVADHNGPSLIDSVF
jgi:hypothetical protein